MRIYLHLSPNRELVPFNYQQSLVGAFHRWLGENELHDEISLYSLSWLQGAVAKKEGLDFPHGATFCISSPMKTLHQKVITGIFEGQHIRWGMKVHEVNMRVTPDFGSSQRFVVQSPVLVKRYIKEEERMRYFYPQDPESSSLLTATMKSKLAKAEMPTDISVAFDTSFPRPKMKKIVFNKIDIKATFCPVIVEGDPRAVQFAWEVGVGNSTGIGFGCLQ
jgi:CRISPR-associated endoribonuclease Cas6